MDDHSFKKEYESIINGYSDKFIYLLFAYILSSIIIIIVDFICGQYLGGIILTAFLIPPCVLMFVNYYKRKNFAISINQVYLLIFCLYASIVIIATIYFNKHPFLYTYFLIILFLIDFLNFQKTAIFFYAILAATVFLLWNFEIFDFSKYSEKVVKYYIIWKYFHIIILFIAVCIIKWSNFKMFRVFLVDLMFKNKALELFQEYQNNIQKGKDTFFSTISHEMRTPLNALKGISDLLISEQLTVEEITEYQRIMNYSANHLLNLVNDVFDYTKINLGEFRLVEQNLNIEENINFAFNINKDTAQNKGISYELVKETAIPKLVLSDIQRFNQILMNLISNAIKFTNKGEVRVSYGGNYTKENTVFMLNIKVVDTGIGIDEANLPLIFDKYFQAKNNSSSSGIGLGLFITKKIIEMMKGQIKVRSNLNVGTSFEMELPLKVVIEKIEDAATQLINTRNKLENLRILIVEDNKINQLVLHKLLQNNIKNSSILIANDGLEAIEKMGVHYFDIVLMDLIMPKMNGLDTSKWIRNHKSSLINQLPIIALTANIWRNDLKSCYASGINDVITKPYEINDIIKKMEKLTLNTKE